MEPPSFLSEHHASLYRLIASKMSIQEELIQIGPEAFRLISVKDVDTLLDNMIQLDDDHEDVLDQRIPYWAELWPSAIALGTYIMASDWIRPEMQVLELGCGLGLPSIVAGKKVNRVWQTDYLEMALWFASVNWGLNHTFSCKTSSLDWRHPNPNMASDIVLASDVAYEERAFEPLLHAFSILVKPGGKLLLSEPKRPIAKPFLVRLQELGFDLRQSELHVSYSSISAGIHVFELSKRSDS